MLCENCGRPINRKTMACEFCGTDYKEYNPIPECEHVYDKIYACQDIKDLTTLLTFHCKRCGEEVTLKCEDYMIRDMFNSSRRL